VILNGGSWNPEAQATAANKLGRNISGAAELRLPPTPQEAARVLYAEFRRLSQSPGHIIWISRKPEHSGENWEAVWDRIERASTLSL
jgi:hypothetical protein